MDHAITIRKPLRVQLMSDLHLENDNFFPGANHAESDVVVLAGDIHSGTQGVDWAASKWDDRPVIVLAGNHELYGGEYHRNIDALRKRAEQYDNIYFLQGDSIVIADVLFAGATLWTDFEYFAPGDLDRKNESMMVVGQSVNDYRGYIYFDRRYLNNDNHSQIDTFTPEDSARLCGVDLDFFRSILGKTNETLANEHGVAVINKKVCVSHHAPTSRGILEKYKKIPTAGAYSSHFDEVASLSCLWLHGHLHSSIDLVLPYSSTRVICNPRGRSLNGLPIENFQFNSSLVVDV